MSHGGRIAALAVAAAMAIAGLILCQIGSGADRPEFAYLLFFQAGLIVIGTLFEGRYRGRATKGRAAWQATGEREIDHETGTALAVWFDPVSGERRYLPVDQRPE